MTEIDLHFRCAHDRLSGNAPADAAEDAEDEALGRLLPLLDLLPVLPYDAGLFPAVAA